jgi:hypothetical protein
MVAAYYQPGAEHVMKFDGNLVCVRYLDKSAGRVGYLYVGIANLAVTAVMHTHFIIGNSLGRPAKLLIM